MQAARLSGGAGAGWRPGPAAHRRGGCGSTFSSSSARTARPRQHRRPPPAAALPQLLAALADAGGDDLAQFGGALGGAFGLVCLSLWSLERSGAQVRVVGCFKLHVPSDTHTNVLQTMSCRQLQRGVCLLLWLPPAAGFLQ